MKSFLQTEGKVAQLKVFVLIVSFLFTVIYFLTPLYGDDLWFLYGTNTLTSRFDTFMVTLGRTAERWHTETGRFANIISSPFLALIPLWMLNILCGLFVWGMIKLSLRLANISGDQISGWLLVAAIVLFLPWYDSMFSRMFSINYVWTATVNLLFILLVLQTFHEIPENFRLNRVFYVVATLFSFLAGWMHEGFSVPILCGFGAIAVLRKCSHRSLPISAWVYTICYALGAFMITLSPMFRERAGGAGTTLTDLPLWEIMIMEGPAVAVSLVLILVAMLKRRVLKTDFYSRQIFFFAVAATLANLAITGIFFGGPRACFFAELIDFIALALLLRGNEGVMNNKIGRVVLKIILVVITVFNLSCAIKEEAELRRETEEIIKLFGESADGVIFYDNIAMKPTPSLLKTSVGQFNLRNLLIDFSYYHRSTVDDPDSQKILQILPSSLKSFGGGGETDCGDSGNQTIIYDGNILIPEDSFDAQSPSVLMLGLSDGTVVTSRFREVRFVASDSTHWVLLKPHLSVYRPLDITSATIQ